MVREGSHDFRTVLQESAPDVAAGTSGWLTTMRNNDAVGHSFWVYTHCATNPPGYQVIRRDVPLA